MITEPVYGRVADQTIDSPNVFSMMAHRQRRRLNIETTLGERLVFAVMQ